MSVDFISWLEVGDAFYILEWSRRATPGPPRPALHRKVIKQLASSGVEWSDGGVSDLNTNKQQSSGDNQHWGTSSFSSSLLLATLLYNIT